MKYYFVSYILQASPSGKLVKHGYIKLGIHPVRWMETQDRLAAEKSRPGDGIQYTTIITFFSEISEAVYLSKSEEENEINKAHEALIENKSSSTFESYLEARRFERKERNHKLYPTFFPRSQLTEPSKERSIEEKKLMVSNGLCCKDPLCYNPPCLGSDGLCVTHYNEKYKPKHK